jgi:hypothetical protein
MKRFTDRKRRESHSYAVGQKVWLDAQNLRTKRPSKKLDLRRLGPFEVLTPVPQDSHNPSTYRLALPTSWKVHPVFHVSLLRPALLDERLHPPVTDDTQPLLDIINGEEEFKVETILDHRGGKHRWEYLVKWRGYPTSDVTWEPKRSLRHTPDVVLQYEEGLEG